MVIYSDGPRPKGPFVYFYRSVFSSSLSHKGDGGGGGSEIASEPLKYTEM